MTLGVRCDMRVECILNSSIHVYFVFKLKERKRIEDAGGFIAMNGVWRVQGILATSRAMGDFPLKNKNVVTSEPDILSFRLKKLDSEFMYSKFRGSCVI